MAQPAVEQTLVLIDVQRAFDDPRWGRRNNPDAEDHIADLLHAWRRLVAPVIHVRHRSRSQQGAFVEGTDAFLFKEMAEPAQDEPILEKSVNSAFIGTDLEERLRASGTSGVVICGFTTDHCCSTTARMSGNLGFPTWFIGDATATFDRLGPDGTLIPAALMHRTALASLHGEFADVIDTEEAIVRLTDTHERSS